MAKTLGTSTETPAPADRLVAFGPCEGVTFTCRGIGIETMDPRPILTNSPFAFTTAILCGACYVHLGGVEL